ncbi:MAG: hypothetical protein K6G10_03260 [Butyrivibrio sp.]|nr:hypothetical protein [Butyrivibrio sp.]
MADNEMTMTYSAIVRDKDNKKLVRVQFTRKGPKGPEIAEGILPACKIEKQKGYSPEEISALETYLKGNCDDIMAKAKVISNPLKWL